jgi:hypothetical protein
VPLNASDPVLEFKSGARITAVKSVLRPRIQEWDWYSRERILNILEEGEVVAAISSVFRTSTEIYCCDFVAAI